MRSINASIVALTIMMAIMCQQNVVAFNSMLKSKAGRSSNNKPTYNKDTEKWEAPPGDKPAYGPFGSFLRQGPNPALVRILSPENYDQAVLKYMASEGCDRAEAQGNMDAFFNNAADWQYQKMEEKQGKPKVDYTVLKPKQAILTLTWAFVITPVMIWYFNFMFLSKL